ncbi:MULTISPECIES: hypothetical protein [Methylomonas]|uniref:hypothetical protein n=1 Tax=Methylomonas TaxID=416 RepID=UPI0012F63F9F|nr:MULTISPECIES: hypothetical protein [Methylomonas]
MTLKGCLIALAEQFCRVISLSMALAFHLSSDTKSEKWSIDFKVNFHSLCHTPCPLLTQKMKYPGFSATNIEKIVHFGGISKARIPLFH